MNEQRLVHFVSVSGRQSRGYLQVQLSVQDNSQYDVAQACIYIYLLLLTPWNSTRKCQVQF